MARCLSAAVTVVRGFILVSLFGSSVSAQGWLSGPGRGSVGGVSSVSISDDGTQISGGVVYSPNGSVDLGFSTAPGVGSTRATLVRI